MGMKRNNTDRTLVSGDDLDPSTLGKKVSQSEAGWRLIGSKGTGLTLSHALRQATFSPVNGTGIVFYLDSTGSLKGILLWGFPFDSSAGLESIGQDLDGVIDRSRGSITAAMENGTVFKYDMNSR
jgi:hypothetical protein